MIKIILDEKAYAEAIIRRSCLGDNPRKALVCVARYYFSLGLSEPAVRESLTALIPKEHAADSVIKQAGKRGLLTLPFIPIYRHELETISAVSGLQRQRVAFALLALAKYQNAINQKNNNWVSFPLKIVFSLANVKMSMNDQCLLMNDLMRLGLLQFNQRVDNLNVKVLYSCAGGNTIIEIRDMRNLGYQYMRHCGGLFLECETCSAVVPRKAPRQKYCAECSQVERARKTLEYYRKKMENSAL